MYQLIDGKKIADQVKQEISTEVKLRISLGKKQPHLAAILVGNDGGSETYVAHKISSCEQVGFKSTLIRLPETVTEQELLLEIEKLNSDADVDGFIVQLPLPKHINEEKILQTVLPQKDVDGFHPENVGKMVVNLPSFLPATPMGILELIKRYQIPTEGKHVVVLGRSNIVGKPVSILLSRKGYPGDATVTVCHSKTTDIQSYTLTADIIIVALGSPEFLKADMVKQGAVVIDVGTTRIKSNQTKSGWKLKGDVAFDEVAPKCSFITPVPGGVGPMTIVSLLKNTLLAAEKK